MWQYTQVTVALCLINVPTNSDNTEPYWWQLIQPHVSYILSHYYFLFISLLFNKYSSAANYGFHLTELFVEVAAYRPALWLLERASFYNPDVLTGAWLIAWKLWSDHTLTSM